MADLTLELEIGEEWTEITSPLMMADGTNYFVSAAGANNNAVIYTAETDAALPDPSAGIVGHPILALSRNRSVDSRIYPKRAGVFAWMRTDRGSARITASATS